MLTMPSFHYLTFMCEQIELQAKLTPRGLEGWRLHTCDPVVMAGPQGSGILQMLVVMDKIIAEDDQQVVVDSDDAHEGIAMKG